MNKKIVYILGAGFSKPANAPQQKEILKGVLELSRDDNPRLKNFLLSFFGHSENIPLEDIFTALDKSINKNESLRRFDLKQVLAVRDDLNNGIIKLFAQRLRGHRPAYVDNFAKRLITLRLDPKSKDQVVVLSTNWDILFDNALEVTMREDATTWENNKRNVYVDYCTFTRSLDSPRSIPSTFIKARGYVNFKLLKLHGSMNWLICPNCESLFVKFEEKVAFRSQVNSSTCRVCWKNHSHRKYLRPLLISPTFLKDLNNVHFKTIWWNAGFELSEASHIVFIGYSLPLSDFELRYLFARNIRSNSKIKVILWSKSGRATGEAAATMRRYTDFLGKRSPSRDITFAFTGVEEYVGSLPDDPKKILW